MHHYSDGLLAADFHRLSTMPVRAVLLDIDGTLVDSNDAHARAWSEAFAGHGIQVSVDAVRRAIGMGGDKLMPAISGISEDSPEGQAIAERRGQIFRTQYFPCLKPFPGARDLVAHMKSRGFTLVAASSASKEELTKLLKVAGVDALLDEQTSSDDAEESKPEPDIIQAALKRAESAPHEAIMIGDTPYDIEAANKAGVKTIAFRCGGWSDEDLRGAVTIYDGPAHLLAAFERSPLC